MFSSTFFIHGAKFDNTC